MIVTLHAQGDIDRLPHKDLLEKIIHRINEAVREELAKHGQESTDEHGYEVQHTATRIRPFLGDAPYQDGYPDEVVDAQWGVHIDG